MANEPKNRVEKTDSISPAAHHDGPTGRPEMTTGAGREATLADMESTEHDREHRSGYGGKGGKPDTSSEKR